MQSLEEKVSVLAEPVASALGLEVIEVEYVSENGEQVLRVYIDKALSSDDESEGLLSTDSDDESSAEAGITVEDCANLSRELSTLLDVEDIVPGHYNLEVSSPGLNRPVRKEKDFLRFKGEKIKLQTKEAVNGRRNFKAHITGAGEGKVVLEDSEGISWIIEIGNVKKARIQVEF